MQCLKLVSTGVNRTKGKVVNEWAFKRNKWEQLTDIAAMVLLQRLTVEETHRTLQQTFLLQMTGACHSGVLSSPYVHWTLGPTAAAKFSVGNSTQFPNYFFPVDKANMYTIIPHLMYSAFIIHLEKLLKSWPWAIVVWKILTLKGGFQAVFPN